MEETSGLLCMLTGVVVLCDETTWETSPAKLLRKLLLVAWFVVSLGVVFTAIVG